MKTREEVHQILEDILGSKNVYFQEPPNTGMKYPAIVYSFNNFNRLDADDKPYILHGRYQVIHMYKSIRNDLKMKFISEIPYCYFERRMITDGIYNDYYEINL